MSTYSNPRSIMHTVPLLRVSVLFLLGIVLGDMCDDLIGLKTCLLIFICLVAVALLLYKVNTTLCNITLIALCVITGICRISFVKDSSVIIDEDKTVECKMAVLSEPIVRGKVVQFDAKVSKDGLIWRDNSGNIHENKSLGQKKLRISLLRDTITGNYKKVHIGDGLVAKVDLSSLKDWHRQNAHFDYIKWLKARDFVGRGFIGIGKWKNSRMEYDDIGTYDYLRIKLLVWREIILHEMKKSGMEAEAYAVASAMALGNKSALTPELRDEYTIVGAAHILALSGVHLSIIYMILSFLLGHTRKRERMCVLMLVWTYVLFVGLPISVVRAACMLTIWDILEMMEMHQRQLNVFGFTLMVMMIVSPESVWDIGFQMSFMAVFAIIVFMEPINRLMPENWKPKNKKQEKDLPRTKKYGRWLCRTLWYIGSASCAAQLGTAPLVAYYFGRVTVLFIFTNFVVVPLSWIIICGTLLMAFMVCMNVMTGGWLIGIVQAVGWCISLVVNTQNYLLTKIAHIPMASIGDVNVNAIQVAAMYAIIIACAVWANSKVLKEDNDGVDYYART